MQQTAATLQEPLERPPFTLHKLFGRQTPDKPFGSLQESYKFNKLGELGLLMTGELDRI